MFTYVTSGESHGPCLTAIVKGVPAGVDVSEEEINMDLRRRQVGYGRGDRMKIEKDEVRFMGGIRNGRTTGAPITLQIMNKDWENWKGKRVDSFTVPRPGHADLIGALKYETEDIRDILERSSARETAIKVAVGALAKVVLSYFTIALHSHTRSLGGVKSKYKVKDFKEFVDAVEASELRCGDAKAEEKMIEKIEAAKAEGDSLGGVIEIITKNVPMGLGTHAHWENRLDARLSYAVMSIQAIKGVEIGGGFKSADLPGSKVHDEIFYSKAKHYYRETNMAGGIEGGMSNGEDIIVRAAMKPIPTLMRPLKSVDIKTKEEKLATKERSDVCAVPAAGVVCEAAIAIEIVNAILRRYGGDNIRMLKRHIEADGDMFKGITV